jgi:transposase
MAHRTPQTSSVPVRTSVELPTTVGLDLSDRISHFHAQFGDGRTLETGKVKNERSSLAGFFERWKGSRLVLEAGGQSAWIARLASECGMEVIVANPRRLDLISKSDRKTDRGDAELLAEIGRTNPQLLSPIQHRSASTHADLSVIRARDALVSSRTALINHVRGMLKSHGYRASKCSTDSFGRKISSEVPAGLESAVRPLLELIAATTVKIKRFDRDIERLGRERHPITQVLQQIGGVGSLVSLCFVLTIEDPKRFRSKRDVAAYLGLVPRKKSSGTSDPQMHITKAGDRQMRRLLVVSANYILGRFGPDCDLRRFGLRIAGPGENKAAKKRAKVAVARKLAVLMLHLWTTAEVYDPLHNAKALGEAVPA